MNFKEKIFQLNKSNFEKVALDLFLYQAKYNLVYKEYIKLLKINPKSIDKIEKVPFLPIEFFKNYKIQTQIFKEEKIFESSGTTGQNTSKHYVANLQFYEEISQNIFENTYGSLNHYHILALLPSYLERDNSSLVYMVKSFIQKSASKHSGFYLDDFEGLIAKIKSLIQDKHKKILLIGVTFALLDLAEQYPNDFSDIIIMETGGMKGRRKEMIREEIHQRLKNAFNINNIHSEYGMTELLSQTYSQGQEVFNLPSTMKILLREVNDPFSVSPKHKTGGVNIIDLANIDSCAFIATQDLGEMINESQFKVLGRFDNSDLRGCNLMVL